MGAAASPGVVIGHAVDWEVGALLSERYRFRAGKAQTGRLRQKRPVGNREFGFLSPNLFEAAQYHKTNPSGDDNIFLPALREELTAKGHEAQKGRQKESQKERLEERGQSVTGVEEKGTKYDVEIKDVDRRGKCWS
jgi:hypothetical protein